MGEETLKKPILSKKLSLFIRTYDVVVVEKWLSIILSLCEKNISIDFGEITWYDSLDFSKDNFNMRNEPILIVFWVNLTFLLHRFLYFNLGEQNYVEL